MIKKPQNNIFEIDTLASIHEFNISVPTRELWLHSPFDDREDEIDYRTSNIFCKNIQYLNQIDPKTRIIVHMQSLGGDWFYGMAIYDAIKNSSAPVTVIGESAVCSMATVIIQAASKRYLMPNTDFMIHSGSFAVSSDTVSAMSDAEQNKRDTEKMFEILARRAATTIKGISYKSHMKFIKDATSKAGNWWLTAEEAVTNGFVDAIIDNVNVMYKDVIK